MKTRLGFAIDDLIEAGDRLCDQTQGRTPYACGRWHDAVLELRKAQELDAMAAKWRTVDDPPPLAADVLAIADDGVMCEVVHASRCQDSWIGFDGAELDVVAWRFLPPLPPGV